MKPVLKWVAGTTLWCTLAAFCGCQIGYHQGYARGVRDISTLVIELHEVAGDLTAAPNRDARWQP